jgi:Flp pilus assembly protein TadD
MKIVLILMVLFNISYSMNPLDYTYTWLTQEYKNFRAYPRISRAYELIDEGDNKGAKVLLSKALTIDANNKEAAHTLLTLCVEEKDNSCINKYKKIAKDVNLGYFYIDKAQKAKEAKNYQKVIVNAKQALGYTLKTRDKAYIQLILFDAYLKTKAYDRANAFIGKERLSTENLLKWSEISSNLKENDYAYQLTSGIPNNIKNLEWQINLLLKNKKKREATKKMEALYLIDKSNKNKKKLIHLYTLTNQKERTVALYQDRLITMCDPYALFYLLDYYKGDSKKRQKVLEESYPFSCLQEKKQIELSLELVNYLKRTNPKKAQRISRKITKSVEKLFLEGDATANEKRLLSLYETSGEKHKIIQHYKNRLKGSCNRYALFYLLDAYKNSSSKKEKVLEESYPYSCLKKEKRLELTLEWIAILNKKSPAKSQKILDELKIEETPPSFLLDISNRYAHLKRYEKSIAYALEYLKSYPNEIMAIKNVGFSYYKLEKRELATHYLLKAAKLDPNDTNLLKNIGYLCSDLEEYKTALFYWDLYLQKKNDPEIRLEVASLYYFIVKDYDRANSNLIAYESASKKKSEKYYLLKAKLAYKSENCKLAINNYDHALKSQYDESVNYEYAHLLQQCREESKALTIMKELTGNNPDNTQYQKELAYMYQKQKKYENAVKNFEKVAKQEPKNFDNYMNLAYAYKKSGQEENAVKAFKKALDHAEGVEQSKIKSIKKEIHGATKLFDIYVAQSLRIDSYDAGDAVIPINGATYDGFGNLRLTYRPRFLPQNMALFVDVSHNHKDVKKSIQPSVGVSYKPLKRRDLTLSAQQMIKVDEGTRNETLLRASLGISSGKNSPSNIYQNLYLDSGYFVKDGSTILYGNYELGKRYKLSKNIEVSPYLTTGGSYSTDNPKKKAVTNLDAGVGVAVTFKPDESKYEPAQYSNKLKLEAREKYAGNAKDKSTVRLQWEFFY